MQPDDLFPMDDKIKEAYSHVVENTAFFGDVALRFPRIVHHYFDRNSEWGGLLRWGLHFCNQTGVFTGGAHQHVLTLMSQELGITEKTPDFMNPYRTERDDVLHTAEAFKKILREEEKRRRKEERGKKSGKALASPAHALNYSAAPSARSESRGQEDRRSCTAVHRCSDVVTVTTEVAQNKRSGG
ncbi:coiled-coil domain-containing protein 134-like isoform X1 [Takifugu flavidus]|nr:coiled-coil domain-containing protein 134-like isoform X1 [Takifugu flavidus]